MKSHCITLVIIICSCLVEANDKWNNLKVTWGINPFGANNFVSLPRDVADALKKGLTANFSILI